MSLGINKACKCNGRGYYLDPRCKAKSCDHRNVKEVVSRDKEGNALEQAPCMECPKRPCSCILGKPYADEIQKRIDSQRVSIELSERYARKNAESGRLEIGGTA
jgi:hypothetical protein